MGFKMGIVGLPNVGKSTLFNALTRTAAAQAANFPFCTIEPNVGEVAVPDARLEKLAAHWKETDSAYVRVLDEQRQTRNERDARPATGTTGAMCSPSWPVPIQRHAERQG